jgi:phage terminase large subunit
MKLSSVIAPSFYDIHKDIKSGRHTHYWLRGGRGSTKSSFTAIEIILGIMSDPLANAVGLRKVKDTLHDSVYEQMAWAIDVLGVSDYWEAKISPLNRSESIVPRS